MKRKKKKRNKTKQNKTKLKKKLFPVHFELYKDMEIFESTREVWELYKHSCN